MTEDPPRVAPGGRDRLRAAVITGVLLVHGLLAIPSPRKLDHDRLGSSPGTRSATELLATVQDSLLAPFRPLLAATGTGQSWGMFATPDRTPRRLEIHVEGPEGWEPVFVKNRLEPAGLHARLSDRRVRAVYDGAPTDGSNPFWGFSRWAGRLALHDHPGATRVRIRLVQTHTAAPDLPADPAESVLLERTFTRLALLDDL